MNVLPTREEIMETICGIRDGGDHPLAVSDYALERIADAILARLRPASELPVSMDVEQLFAQLKASGLDGLSHEDGWTLMKTETADALKKGRDALHADLELRDSLNAEIARALEQRNADLAACVEALEFIGKAYELDEDQTDVGITWRAVLARPGVKELLK